MKILLLGGTGAIGSHLSKILSSNSNEVFVTTRKVRENTGDIKYLVGNAHDDLFIKEILKEKWDCIVDFMAYQTAFFSKRVDTYLEATNQYIYISSSRVYANSNEPITENSPRLLDIIDDPTYKSTDEYALAKARQENLLFDNKNQNWTIIRPYITYSEERLQLGVLEKEEWLYLALCGKALIFSEDLFDKKTTLTYGYDVAIGIAGVIGKQSCLGEAFHITNNKTVTWGEVFNLYSNVLENRNFKFNIYKTDYCYRKDIEGSKYQLIYDRYYDRVFDNSKIGKYVNIDNFLSPLEGLNMCLNKFLDNYVFLFKNLTAGVITAIKKYHLRIKFKDIDGIKQKIKYMLIKLKLN